MDVSLISEQENLIDAIRDPKCLKYSEAPVILHNIEFCGKTANEKFKEVFDFIESKYSNYTFFSETKANQGCIGLVITRLDNIACIFKKNQTSFILIFFGFIFIMNNI